MENFNLGKKKDPKKKFNIDKVSNFIKAAPLSMLINNSKINTTLADNLYANRILEEELIASNKFFSEFTPSLPKGSKIIDLYGSHYVNIGDKMYYIREFNEGFDLVDNTRDFIPEKYLGGREYKRRSAFQKKYGLSATTEVVPREEFYRYSQASDGLDNWIIHNDMGKINKNRFGKDETWWLKGKPYKGMVSRSLLDQPEGRHLFAKQSALESSIGKPLDEHRELIGDIIKEGKLQDGGITITPTSEADLYKVKGLRSFTHNPITKSIERGIFHKPNTPKDKKEDYKHTGWDYDNTEK